MFQKTISCLLCVLCLLLTLNACTGKSDPLDQITSTTNSETATPPETPPVQTTLNVMSFNIYYLNEKTTAKNDNTVEVDATIATRGPKLNALLEGEQIDVVGFQELSEDWRAWMKKSFHKSYEYVGGWQDCCKQAGYVAYRADKFTALEHGIFWLAPDAPEEPVKGWGGDHDRICTWVIFQVKETGEYFLFLDTHLDNAGSMARRKGSELIVSQITVLQQKVVSTYGSENCPVILVGDMNDTPTSAMYKNFTAVLRDSRVVSEGKTLSEKLSTSPGFQHYRSANDYVDNGHLIDYIFVSDTVTVRNYKMIHTASNLCKYGEYISDHNAIIAKISFAPSNSAS